MLQGVGSAIYIHDLVEMVQTPASAMFYAHIVKRNSILRSLIMAGSKIVQMGYVTDGSEIEDVINEAQYQIYKITEKGVREDYEQIREVLEDTVSHLESLSGTPDPNSIPTGLDDLDKLLGNLQPGQMVVVAARPGLGKSTFGLDIARSAAVTNNKTAILFSLEMSKREIAMRLLSAETGIPLYQIRSGKIEGQWDVLSRKQIELGNKSLFIDDSANMSIMDIRAKARKLKQKHDLKLIIVDYLQLMSSGKKVESRQQEVSEFSRSLKLLAKELNLPIVALSQLNRGVETRTTDKKPKLADLRESGSIEQDADIVILIHRQIFQDDAEPSYHAELIVAKHRNGPTKTIKVGFQGELSRFFSLPKEEQI
jgi:replicative DNA helicase